MTTDPTPTTTPPPAGPDRTTRRRALLGLAGVAATGAAGVVSVVGSPPSAAGGPGESLTLGDPFNTADATTALATDLSQTPALVVQNAGGDLAIEGISGFRSGLPTGSGAAIAGETDQHQVRGVAGLSQRGDGVHGQSLEAHGVQGVSVQGVGVFGRTTRGQAAMWGENVNPLGFGIIGQANGRSGQTAGVLGANRLGVGLQASGLIQLRLEPGGQPTPPSAPEVGSVHVDSAGTFRAAIAYNRWRTIVGPSTAGALHVLPAPVRAYDSRPGTLPNAGPKTKLGANQVRVLDLRAAVPAGATAALLTVLLVNATNGNGNLTVWADGVDRPLANSMVWGGALGRYTATPTTAVDVDGRVQVHASLATDLVVDVVGYYA